MPIENRSLTPGTRLVARHHKQEHTCTVEQGEDGKPAYVLADGSRHKSPSAAGSAVMGGTACNGWRLWSVEGADQPARSEKRAPAPKARRARSDSTTPLISRLKKQDGASDGMVRYFCSACMEAFEAPEGEPPTVCAQGHGAVETAEPTVV